MCDVSNSLEIPWVCFSLFARSFLIGLRQVTTKADAKDVAEMRSALQVHHTLVIFLTRKVSKWTPVFYDRIRQLGHSVPH